MLPAGFIPELTEKYFHAEGQGWCQQRGRELGEQQAALPWLAAVQLLSGSLAWHQSQGSL